MVASDRPSFYGLLAQQLRRHWLRVLGDEKHGVLSFPPEAIDEVAHTLFSNVSHGGFATFVVSGRHSWDPQSYYFEATRRAAERGCEIMRAFLLPHRQYLKEEVLHEHWRLDTNAGIKVQILYVGDLMSTLVLTPPFGLDFGLWDDQLVCTAVSRHGVYDKGPSEWRISSRPEDIELAQALRDELLSKAIVLTYPSTGAESLDLEEPMVQTAPLMDLLSGAVCSGSYVSTEDCSWYHGVWQYLRILDLVSTPTWHPDFYIPQLKLFAQKCDNSKILISGTADYSTLAHVLWAFDKAQKRCDVTVLDLCQTPLILCQWYARRVKHRINTVKADILTFRSEDLYDAIVTDAFLTRFPKQKRSKVIECWSRLLKPGGRVVTTVRIEDSSATGKVVAHPEQVDLFRSRALKTARRWQDFLPLSPQEIAIKAQRYAERMVSNPISSADELKDEFIRHGFSLSHLKVTEVKGEMAPTTYVQVVAKKTAPQ